MNAPGEEDGEQTPHADERDEEEELNDVLGGDDPSADGDDGTEDSLGTVTLARAPGALSKHDPLAAYMRDVQKYKLLSPTEEHELAVKYAEKGDVAAAKALVTSNLRLVVKIAYGYRQAYKNLLDLIQEGNIGLMQAVQKFDPYKGVKLSTYAAWWIRAYMLRYILNTHRMVKIGTTQAQRKLFFNLKKEKAKLAARGIEPTPQMIAENLDVPEQDVVQMERRLSAGDASLDAPVGNEEGRTISRVELLRGDAEQVDDVIANDELEGLLLTKIRAFGETLKEKEAAIFRDRLMSEDPRTLQEIGDDFGVSRERVRQIEKRLLEKLRVHLGEEMGDAFLDLQSP